MGPPPSRDKFSILPGPHPPNYQLRNADICGREDVDLRRSLSLQEICYKNPRVKQGGAQVFRQMQGKAQTQVTGLEGSACCAGRYDGMLSGGHCHSPSEEGVSQDRLSLSTSTGWKRNQCKLPRGSVWPFV